jgi:hypothetical protein
MIYYLNKLWSDKEEIKLKKDLKELGVPPISYYLFTLYLLL